jgi:bifunctional oligoribonuclease and PAP phosphatase NrnA
LTRIHRLELHGLLFGYTLEFLETIQMHMKQLFDQFKEIFASKKTFVLTTHINPDGDGLGSEVALALYLTAKGKSVSVINQSETPAYYTFMKSLFPIATFSDEKHAGIIRDSEVIIALDTNSPSRFSALKDSVLQSRALKICIDHHPDLEAFADLYLIDEQATATGEIIFRLLKHLDENFLTPPIAEALYAAIMTDTGSFRFPKTDPETHRIAAELLEHGADPTKIYQEIFEEGPANKLKLLGRALNTLSVLHHGAVATMILQQKDFSETLTSEEDTDNMINFAMSIGGVKVGLMFIELAKGVKVSFRSKGNIPINKLAKEFGGNGHMNAAGARIYDSTLDDVVKRVAERSGTYEIGRAHV